MGETQDQRDWVPGTSLGGKTPVIRNTHCETLIFFFGGETLFHWSL